MFGPTDIQNKQTDIDENEMERIEEKRRTGCKKIKQGHKRIMEKIKKTRQSFSNFITNGRRSGSGKVLLEHYDSPKRGTHLGFKTIRVLKKNYYIRS